MNFQKFCKREEQGKWSEAESDAIWKQMAEAGRLEGIPPVGKATKSKKAYHPNGGVGKYINATKSTKSLDFKCSNCYGYYSNSNKVEVETVEGVKVVCSYCADSLKFCSKCNKMSSDAVLLSGNPKKYICQECLPKNERYQEFKKVENSNGESLAEWKKYWRYNFNSNIAEWYILHMRKATYKESRSCGFSSMLYSKLGGQGITAPNAFEKHIRKVEEDRFEFLTKELEEFFKTYIIVSCIGESRYAWSMVKQGIESLPSWLPIKEIVKHCPQRSEVWNYATWLIGKESITDLAVDLVGVFGLSWGSCAYGGEKWQSIAQHLMDYLSGSMSRMIFVDQAVSLCHNGNIFLDKLGIDIYSTKAILDYKLEATKENYSHLMYYVVGKQRYWYLKEGE